MKNYLIPLILIFNLLIFNFVNAETKITYLDLDKVLVKSLAGKSINDSIFALQKKNSESFIKDEKKIIDTEKKILSQKNLKKKLLLHQILTLHL